MDAIVLTPQDVDRLNAVIALFQRSRNEASDIMNDPTTGDSFHDESFARSDIMENILRDRIEEMQAIIDNATVITPEEQSGSIQLGSGVQLKYLDDDKVAEYILVGYVPREDSERCTKMTSTRSPLGKCIVGATVDEVRILDLGERRREVQIVKIYLPSETNALP